ncbi:MAG TPA: dihydrodipicolinate synthase family protein, partial [Herpetosiphonaceae bacterium]|nr:dihydrodipicolinate synthase family protein [Herpetosiphonaceae bacterium]
GPLLRPDEWREVTETTVRAARGRVPVIVQAGALTTAESVERAQIARACGVDAIALLAPYYYHYPDAALVEHFCAIAASVPDLPVFLYNLPQRTSHTINVGITEAVAARCANVVGEKDSSGDLQGIGAKLRLRDGRFQMLVGTDGLILPALSMGGRDAVSGHANIVPELVVTLFNAFQQGDLDGARRAQERLDRVRAITQDGTDLSLFKGVLAEHGIAAGPVRPPLGSATAEEIAACRGALRQEGLLAPR